MENIFETLYKIDVSKKIEKKGNLSYLSWSWAWAELKKVCPNAEYTVYENPQGWNYFTDGKTAWVKTGVKIDGLEYIEYLPIMDFKNKSIPVGNITSMDVNKTIQRSITKAIARHGLGLTIYAGEDLPEDYEVSKAETPRNQPRKAPTVPDMAITLESMLNQYAGYISGDVKQKCYDAIDSGNGIEQMYERLVSYLGKKGVQVA